MGLEDIICLITQFFKELQNKIKYKVFLNLYFIRYW